MKVLEFLSHLETGVHVHISDITRPFHPFTVNARAEELEGTDFSGWHDLLVADWSISKNGRVYIEGRVDEHVRTV